MDIENQKKQRSPLAMALLNMFIPGAAYLMLRLYKRFYVLYGAIVVYLVILFAIDINAIIPNLTWYIGNLLAFYAAGDVHVQTQRLNRGEQERSTPNRLLLWVGICSILALLLFSISINVYAVLWETNRLNQNAVWRTFDFDDQAISISLPAAPIPGEAKTLEYGNEGKSVSASHFRASESAKQFYMMNIYKYPEDVFEAEAQEALTAILQAMVTEGETKTSTSFEQFGKYSALRFDHDEGGLHFRGINVLVGRTIYAVTFADRADSFDEARYQKFISSLKVNEY